MPIPLLAHLWLASASLGPSSLAPGEVDAVEMEWWRYQQLKDAATEDSPGPGPWAADREIELQPVEGGWELRARWTLHASTPGWIWEELVGEGIELRRVTLGGKSPPIVSLPGSTMLAAWIQDDDGRGVPLEVRGFVPAEANERFQLELMPATRGRLRASAPGRVLVPVALESGQDHAPALLEGGVIWSGASVLGLELRDPGHAPPARETLAVAHAGVGLTIGDAELRGRAHLQWELRHGSLSRVRATVSELGDDLTVEGPDVATWSRQGDTLEVELTAPVSGRVDLDLRWSQSIPASDETRQALPRIEPEAWRSESSLQLARDGEIEVIPGLDDWAAVASAELPAWGQGLVEGTPTAAYQRAGGTGPGHLDLLRFMPVPGPPTVIDVASYTLATTDEGRVLMKAYYELRNDRGAHLTVVPPEGLRIIGARVAGETAFPSRGEDGAWRIPLKRSLETVEGLLSFPVEVILLGEQEPWSRRERRDLALPTLDAPIAASHVTVHLPPRYDSRLETGEHNVVASFGEGEGLAYGKGVGQVGSAAADALFQEAVEGYLANDFGNAQAKLEELEGLGVSNENMVRLQSNIDVIEGKANSKDNADVTLQRRVKGQAKARAVEEIREQELLIDEAEKSAQAGDYSKAAVQYGEALELGNKLAKLEQTESVEQRSVNDDVEFRLNSVNIKTKNERRKKKKKGKKGRGKKDSRWWSSSDSAEHKASVSSGADDKDVFGGLTGTEVSETFPEPKPEPEPISESESEFDPVPPESIDVVLGNTDASGIEMDEDGIPDVPDDPTDAPMLSDEDEDDDIQAEMGSITVVQRQRQRRGLFRRGDGRPTVKNKNSRRRLAGRSGGGSLGRKRRRRTAGTNAPDTKSVIGGDFGPDYRNAGSRAMPSTVYDPNEATAPPADPAGPSQGAPAGAKTPESSQFKSIQSMERLEAEQGRLMEEEAREMEQDKKRLLQLEAKAQAAASPGQGGESAAPVSTPPAIERLPSPAVTASALSVVIPATGFTVRYEQLLIDANQTQFITIDARRRLRR